MTAPSRHGFRKIAVADSLMFDQVPDSNRTYSWLSIVLAVVGTAVALAVDKTYGTWAFVYSAPIMCVAQLTALCLAAWGPRSIGTVGASKVVAAMALCWIVWLFFGPGAEATILGPYLVLLSLFSQVKAGI